MEKPTERFAREATLLNAEDDLPAFTDFFISQGEQHSVHSLTKSNASSQEVPAG